MSLPIRWFTQCVINQSQATSAGQKSVAAVFNFHLTEMPAHQSQVAFNTGREEGLERGLLTN